MAQDAGNTGLQDITPEQFAQLVASASDEDILTTIHSAGTEAVLDRVFAGMQERFRPDQAQGVDAVIVFTIDDEGTAHSYTVTIRDGSCTVEQGAQEPYKVALSTDLLSFVKLVGGQAEGVQLFMGGKLKVKGDMMFSARIMTFFDRPKA